MADTKISALTAASSTDGTEVLPIVQSATTKKLAISKIKDYILGVANVFTKAQTFQPDSDAQSITARRYSSTQSANVLEVQTEANAVLASIDKTGALSTPSISLSGNISSAAWTTSGLGVKVSARTLTDTSSSGTVAAAYTNVLGGNTIAASNATTFTDYASLQLGTPTAGTNVTITNGWSLIAAGNIRAPSVSLGVAGSTLGTLKLSGNTSGTVTVQTAAAAGTWTMTLPADAGTDGYLLKTNGSGVTSWVAAASGGSKTLAVFTPMTSQPPASNFATLDTRNSIAVLDFDAATAESTVFVGVIPEGATLTSGIKARIFWMATTATSGDCKWGVSFEAYGTDNDSDSFDTEATAYTTASGTSGIAVVTEITCTTIDSLAAGAQFRCKIRRVADDATYDTMSGDAELVAVELRAA